MGHVRGVIGRCIATAVHRCLDEVLHALFDSLIDEGLALPFFAFEALAFRKGALFISTTLGQSILFCIKVKS